MMGQAPFVFDTYFKIASALAHDSIKGVAADAAAMGEAIRRDRGRMLPPEVAAEADALAQVNDLSRARIVFKRLSDSLIRYLAGWDVTDTYEQLYCPVTKANWLQKKETDVENPYLGQRRLHCGIQAAANR